MRHLAHASACAVLAASLPAQIPPHATTLNPSGAIFASRSVLQVGERVHVVGDSNDGVLRHARSSDGGRSWDVVEQPVVTGTDPNYPAFPIEMAAVGNDTILLTHESQTALEVLRSADAGLTWQTIPVSTAATSVFTLRRPQLFVAGQLVLVTWSQNDEVFVSRSTDGGLTWPQIDVRIDNGIPASVPGPWYELRPFPIGDATALTILWSTKSVITGGGVTLRQQSFDGGLTWQLTPQQVSNLPFHSIAGRDGPLLASWLGPHLSLDQGATWTALSLGTTGFVEVGVSGSTLCVAGDSATSNDDLLCASFDGGSSWQTTNASGVPFTYPRALATDGVAYAWFPQDKVHYNRGSGWRPLAGDVHLAFSPGERRNVRLTRINSTDVSLRAYVGTGYTVLGTGTTGTGGLAPRLRTSGITALGDTFAFDLDRMVPTSIGALGVSQPSTNATPPTGIPFAGGLVWPTAPLALVAFATGSGDHAEPVAVPNDPALIDTSTIAQAVVLDAAGSNGLTLSNGIEVWLR